MLLSVIAAFALQVTPPHWVEVPGGLGFASAVLVSDIDITQRVRKATWITVSTKTENPSGQNFTLERGVADCEQRTVSIDEIVIYYLAREDGAIHLPIVPDPRPIREGSAADLICDWPVGSNEDGGWSYASDFADAVRSR